MSNCGVTTIFLCIICLIGCSPTKPLKGDISNNSLEQILGKRIPAWLEQYKVPGISIAITRKNNESLVFNHGVSDKKQNISINANTIYPVASLGKPIFAYIVVALAKQGLLDLDVPLINYIDKEVVTDDPRSSVITARMALNHTSGLNNLNSKSALPTFSFKPGSAYQYSGHAYLYLQRVIEHLTQKSLNELANELVFSPLSMNNTSFVWKEFYDSQLSKHYDDIGDQLDPIEKNLNGYSAWSLYTNIEDYQKFVQHMVMSSRNPQSVPSEMLKEQFKITEDIRWSLGWGIQNTKPNQSFWHWGSMGGYKHFVVAYPQEELSIIVLSNGKATFKFIDDLIDFTIGGELPAYHWF